MSENKEALVVLGGSIGTAITVYLTNLPIPAEIKAPTVALSGAITAALLVFWKSGINTEKDKALECE